jgi:cytoskeletal protein RodZ
VRGIDELRKQGFGLIDKIKRELSFPHFNTQTDTDVIFCLLDYYFGLRCNLTAEAFRKQQGSQPPPLPSSFKNVRFSPLEKFGLVVIGFVGALFVLYALMLIFTVVGERETRRRLDNTNERRIDAVDFLDTTNPKYSPPAVSNDAIRHAGEQKPSQTPESSATPSEEQNAVEGKEVRKAVPVEIRRAIPVEPAKP